MSSSNNFLAVPQSFSVQALAREFGWSPKSIYNDLDDIRRGVAPPEKLPPFFCRPGSNRPIFVQVSEWVEAQLQRQKNLIAKTSTSTPASALPPAKKRGRKTNKEKAALAAGGEA